MTVHSKIGASSMYRWSKCPGSVRLSETVPKAPSSSYAEEGTEAHEIAAALLMGKDALTGIEEDDLVEAVTLFSDTVFEDIKAQFDNLPYEKLVEQSFDLSEVYPGCYGTADCVLYFPHRKKLIVYDYKHGQGIPVDVQSQGVLNPQLQYYGLGALISTGHPVEEVELVIVQPRCTHPDGPVRRATVSALELLDFCADLIQFAKKTEDPNAALVPGDHCRFCPAAGVCPALESKAQLVAKAEFSQILSYDPEKLAETLSKLSIVEAWVKNVREFAYQEAMHGRLPPGWKLAAKRATRRWKPNAPETVADILGLSVDDLLEIPKVKSPAQVEKLLDKEGRAKLSDLVTAESSGMSLVPESDRREAARKGPETEFSAIDDDVRTGTSLAVH